MIPISLFKLLINSFFEPIHLWKATELKRKKSITLFLLISLLVSIPFFIGNFKGVTYISDDISRVIKHIPAFTIEDGGINPEEPLEKAIVAKTDTMNLIFDINNQYDNRQEEKDVESTILNLVFKKDSFTIITSQVPINFAYAKAEGLTDEFFKSFLLRFSIKNTVTFITIILLSFLTGMVEASIRLLLFTIVANIVSAFFRIRLPFSVNWKIMMVACFIPILIFTVLNSFMIYPYGQMGITAVIVAFLYYRGIKGFIDKQIK